MGDRSLETRMLERVALPVLWPFIRGLLRGEARAFQAPKVSSTLTVRSKSKDTMGKLSGIKPRLGGLSSRFLATPRNQRERDKQRRQTQPWRAWYKTARWQKLRQEVLKRDKWTCQRTGQLCIGKSNEPNAAVVNHKTPHRGDETLFWDINNLEVVTKAVHDTLIQKEEQSSPKGVWS